MLRVSRRWGVPTSVHRPVWCSPVTVPRAIAARSSGARRNRGGSVSAPGAPPDGLALALPDLRSRLSQCTRIVLAPLDDESRREVLRERARRRGLSVDPAALEWLMRRVGRDLGGLARLFDRLDQASLAAQRRLTVPFLRETLGG